MKIVKMIQLKIVIFTAMKNRCILHGRVFVMLFGHNMANWCFVGIILESSCLIPIAIAIC